MLNTRYFIVYNDDDSGGSNILTSNGGTQKDTHSNFEGAGQSGLSEDDL